MLFILLFSALRAACAAKIVWRLRRAIFYTNVLHKRLPRRVLFWCCIRFVFCFSIRLFTVYPFY